MADGRRILSSALIVATTTSTETGETYTTVEKQTKYLSQWSRQFAIGLFE
jgi:hypothetical protein